MKILLVVDQPRSWPLHIPGVEVVAAREYLTNPDFANERRTRVFNCCRSYRYQSRGYYVSLLAMARGHQVLPDIATIQGLRSTDIVRLAASDMDHEIQRSLRKLQSDDFVLSIYFGRNLAKTHEDLAQKLFAEFPAPFLRATFHRAGGRWALRGLQVIGAKEIAESHHAFAVAAAQDYFGRRKPRPKRYAYDLAILVNSEEPSPPSNAKALEHFAEAARRAELRPTFIGKDDFGRLGQFDALFIRETTAVNHHTFRFAQAAAAKGLVVIDDPESIIRCTNKVYLAELLTRARIPAPATMVVSKDSVDEVITRLGLPVVLKQPDSSFSQGVFKAETAEDLAKLLEELLDQSDLVIAQAFTPTDYDWRIGLIDGEVLYACRYHMARGHWQIYQTDGRNGIKEAGDADTVPVEAAPPHVVKTAKRAADLIGHGLYGVDLKEHSGRAVVIEVNDNPSIDAGVEDDVIGRRLYDQIMATFRRRLDGEPKDRNQ